LFIFRTVETNVSYLFQQTSKIQSGLRFNEAALRSLTTLNYALQKEQEQNRQDIHKIPFLSLPLVIYSQKNLAVMNELDDKIELMKAAGLINFWYSQFINEDLIKNKPSKRPKVITLKQFKGIFGILMLGSVASFIAFVFEKLLFKVK
jgi:hypothetical protein